MRATQNKFIAATLGVKDKFSHLARLMCIDEFNCSCGVSDVSYTMRQLTQHLRWLFWKGPNNNYLLLLVMSGDLNHKDDMNMAFDVIRAISNNLQNKSFLHFQSIVKAMRNLTIWMWQDSICSAWEQSYGSAYNGLIRLVYDISYVTKFHLPFFRHRFLELQCNIVALLHQ